MTIYTDKIVVSFYHNDRRQGLFSGRSRDGERSSPSGQSRDNNECIYNSLKIGYCPLCKSYKEKENFRSFQKSKEFNIICRRCLDKQNSQRKVFKSFKK